MISYKEYKLKGYKNIAKVMKYYKKHMKLFIGFFSITLLVAVMNFLVPFLQGTTYDVKYDEDLVVNGLGFVKIVDKGVIDVYIDQNVDVFLRKSLI